MKYATRFCWLFFFVFALANQSFAVEISEVHPTQEYIEIFSHEDVSLQGWHYSEMTSTGKENIYAMPYKSIKNGEYLVITLSSKINDTGDTIRLYDTENIVQDEITIPAKKENFSYSKVFDEWIWQTATFGENNDIALPSPTPSASSTPSSSFIGTLFISEMLPNPEGSDSEGEFFELYNNSEQEILLDGFFIEDASGKKYFFHDVSIAPLSYLAFYAADTKLTLNNNAETLRLYDSQNTFLHQLFFDETIEEGKSWLWTAKQIGIGMPSPNQENSIIPISSDFEQEENKMIPLVPIEKKTNPVRLQITKISPNASLDSIDVHCIECNTDIANIRLLIDGLAYTIPENIFAKTGDTLRFVFQKDSTALPEPLADGWIFYVPASSLSLTDESIMLIDSDSQIIDGMCYANYNQSLEGKEKKDIAIMILQNHWKGSVEEYDCVDVSVFPKNSVILRKNQKDTNTKDDFHIILPFSQESSTPSSSLFFSEFVVSPTAIEGKIINRGEEAAQLHDVGLYNAGDFITSLGDHWLLYGQEIVFRIRLDTKKNVSLDSLLLEIRSPSLSLLDVLCFNWEEKNLSTKQKNKMEEALRLGKWSMEFNVPQCFSQYSQEPIVFKRTDFYKTGVLSYQSSKMVASSLFVSPTPSPKNTFTSSDQKPKASKKEKKEKKEKPKIISHNDIHALHIEKVLPNPDGIDAGMEALYLFNQSPKGGWARGWKIRIVSGEKEKEYALPFLFLRPWQKITISKPFLPSLPNTAEMFLLNPYGENVQKIQWNKAKSGQWFGPNAPLFIEKSKKKKAKKKTSSKKNKSSTSVSQVSKIPNDQYFLGNIKIVENGIMWIQTETKWIIAPIPTYLPFSSRVFTTGKTVEIHEYKGKIKNIRPIEAQIFTPDLVQQSSVFSVFGYSFSMISGGFGLWYFSRKRNKKL